MEPGEHEDLTEFDTVFCIEKVGILSVCKNPKKRQLKKAKTIERKTGIRKKESEGNITTYEDWD